MWRLLLSILLACLLLTACGREPPTPDPFEVAIMVAEAVQATVSALPAPTCIPPTATPVPTPEPTATPVPTPEPTATPTPAPVTGEVIANVLNLREGPGNEHPMIGSLSEGEKVTLGEVSPDGEWARLAGEPERWVALSFLRLSGDAASLATSTAEPPAGEPATEPAPAGGLTATPQPAPTATPKEGCPQGCEMPPPGCKVKGNIRHETGEKIYYLPGDKHYEETRVAPPFGERWFCTPEEAEANGWQRTQE